MRAVRDHDDHVHFRAQGHGPAWRKRSDLRRNRSIGLDPGALEQRNARVDVAALKPMLGHAEEEPVAPAGTGAAIVSVSIFGGVNKTILSKDFKGGDIVNIFGGAELDFTQADIDGRVYLDITQIFGGTKIIVPSNWQVVSDLAAVFASVDDKRIKSTASNVNGKILVLKGVSIFAGVDIRSY